MKVHKLKTDMAPFNATILDLKPFEIRNNDRDFELFDHVVLEETTHSGLEMQKGKPLEYTGRQLTREVTHIQSGYGLPDGLVVLGLRKI